MSRLFILCTTLLLACPQPPLVMQLRRGPPDERWVDPGPDPFAGRRDVEPRPSIYVRTRDDACSASLFLGPKACFVRGAREFVDDSVVISEAPPSVPFEYWLECGEVAHPCSAETPVTCVCRTP